MTDDGLEQVKELAQDEEACVETLGCQESCGNLIVAEQSSASSRLRTVSRSLSEGALCPEDSCESQGSERMAVASNVSCTREGVPSVSCASAIEGRSRPSRVGMVLLRTQVDFTCARRCR